jgi:NAD(P)-dependent dehydrogenase (short-subunit alcohol dehydrogenase family)
MRTALVQGASRGLGLALARALLARPDCDRVIATSRDPAASDGLAALAAEHGDALLRIPLDVRDEGSIETAAKEASAVTDRLHWLWNVAGVLHDEAAGVAPEKRLEHVAPDALRRVFEVNAFGPLLVARHFLPLLRHDERSVLANVSARVGSIGDDRLGGWYAYRGSKAALNLFTRNLAIELRRRAPHCVCVAVHPGTVDTALSRPFQGSVPEDGLFAAGDAAARLLAVTDGLGPEDTGSFRAWDGSPIPW